MKFSVILPEEVVEYKRFLWKEEVDGIYRCLNRLSGLILNERGVSPVYLPTFSFEKRAGQIYIEIHFSKWQSLVTLIDKYGIHPKLFDLRKVYRNE